MRTMLLSTLPGSHRGVRLAAPISARRIVRVQASTPPRDEEPGNARPWAILASKAVSAVSAFGLSVALALSPPAAAEGMQILRFPASENPEIAQAQQTLIQAWNIVGQTFYDPSLNNTDWMEELMSALSTAYTADDGNSAYDAISGMLSGLGDPYTRFAKARDFEDFRMSSQGHLEGVGMLVASSEGKLRVVAPIRGSPADRAGIQPGDELLSVNGKSIAGFNGEQVAALLRGESGTSVAIRLHRRTIGTPGVAARPDSPIILTRQIRMRREPVELKSVYSELIPSEKTGPVGYISLRNFSETVPRDTAEAIEDLANQGATSFILDLRDNGGGLVQSGLEVARLWLDGPAPILHVSGRMEDMVQDVNLEDGAALTDLPLAVLVNKNSASASEILAGALHDNKRAIVIGNSTTFGKGKIQSVYEMQDGSALFVTIAKYTTPNHHEIDQVGIRPDMSCGQPSIMEAADNGYAALLNAEVSDDVCVRTAEQFLSRVHHRDA